MLIPYLLASFLNANVSVFETRVLRQSTGLEREEVTRDCIIRSFMICTAHQISLG